ncbi:SNARE associated protein, partial [mine drainage metagenome]
MLFSIVSSLMQLVSGSTALIEQFIHAYGYLALFIAMALESSSLPVPSEVVMPLAGALSHAGFFNFWIAFFSALAGSILGLAVDYYIGYYIGKDIVYKHLKSLRISKEKLDSFDKWFERNGIAAVF